MDFEYNEEQTMLRDTTRDVLVEVVRRSKSSGLSPTPISAGVVTCGSRWPRSGFSDSRSARTTVAWARDPIEISAVLGEFGRALAPEPLLDAVLIPGGLIADTGSAEQTAKYLPALASGELLAAYAHNEPGDRWPHAAVATSAAKSGDGYTLTGRKNPVLHGDCADVLVVTARLDGEIGLFLVETDGAGVHAHQLPNP